MTQHAFHNTHDDIIPPTVPRVRTVLFLIMAIVVGLVVSLLYFATDRFTRGSLQDLTLSERQVLDDINASGILVRDSALPCTMDAHIVVDVNWNSQLKRYCVSTIGLRNVEYENIASFLDRFPGLREIKAPYLSTPERERLANLVPDLSVTGL